MSKQKKVLIGVGIALAVAAVAFINIKFGGKKATEVDVQTIAERELKQIVSASGEIRPKTSVDISASISGKIYKVAVEEGDEVEKGQFLIQIDPTNAETAVRQTRASLSAAKTNLELARANAAQTAHKLKRKEALFEKKLASEEEVQDLRTQSQVQNLQAKASEQEVARLQAMMRNAQHELSKVNIHADIGGTVTRVNIEEGENAFVGAFNNAATILTTVSDLSVIEAEVEVDETDIVDIKIDQVAEIFVDAYPDTSFKGKVTKVGHSPIISAAGGQQATSFEVIVQLTEVIPNVRPGLSCKAEITTGYREKAVAVPIQALTLRTESDLKPAMNARERRKAAKSTNGSANNDEDDTPMEGVFVVKDDAVTFHAVKTGIAGDRYFEAVTGLQEGDVVASGPFSALRKLKNTDPVKVRKNQDNEEKS